MIKTWKDLRHCLAEDKRANDIDDTLKGWLKWHLNPRLLCINDLRHLEYFTNRGGI